MNQGTKTNIQKWKYKDLSPVKNIMCKAIWNIRPLILSFYSSDKGWVHERWEIQKKKFNVHEKRYQ